MFQDNSGGTSAIRVVFIGVTGIVMVLWAGLSIRAFTLLPLPESIVWIVTGLASAKCVQRFGEK